MECVSSMGIKAGTGSAQRAFGSCLGYFALGLGKAYVGKGQWCLHRENLH